MLKMLKSATVPVLSIISNRMETSQAAAPGPVMDVRITGNINKFVKRR